MKKKDYVGGLLSLSIPFVFVMGMFAGSMFHAPPTEPVASFVAAQEFAAESPEPLPKPLPSDPLPKAEVSIEGPETVVQGRTVGFMLKGLPERFQESFDWVIFNRPDDATVFDVSDRRSGDPILIFSSMTAGTYAVIADVNVEPLSDCRLLVHEFTVGGNGPDPDPDPDPDPTKDLFGVIVEESSDRIQKRDGKDVNFGPVLLSPKLWRAFDEGHLRVVDEDGKQVSADLKPYLDRAEADSRRLPWLYLANEKGEVLYDGPLPADPDEAVKVIERYKAKGKNG